MKLNRIIRIIMGNKIMILSRLFFFLIPVLVSGPVNAQESRMIRVFFRYGSIPVQGHEDSEYQEVGGFFGGHVSLGRKNDVTITHLAGRETRIWDAD